MNEHYCPYCRREVMTGNHAADCLPGQTMLGQNARLSLHMDKLWVAIKADASRSLPGRLVWWIASRVYGIRV